jgi:hypothetical protein
MAEEEKQKSAGIPEKAAEMGSAQEVRQAVEATQRITEIVGEFEKAKLPFQKLEALMPQVKMSSGETMVSLSVLNPAKKEDRHKFMTRPQFEVSRKVMIRRLKQWHKLLASSEDVEDLRNTSSLEAQALEENIANNMTNIYEQIKPLEISYRSVQQFYANSSPSGDPVNSFFSNVGLGDLIDPDSDKFEELADYIKKPFRAFSLKDCYSLMVVPGFLEDIPNVDKLAKLAEENKVHIVTDLPNYESFREAQEQMNGPALEGLAGSTPEKAHVSVLANWILGRQKNRYEQEDLWLPPSSVLAGLMYKQDEGVGMQQPCAGYQYGATDTVKAVRFEVDRAVGAKEFLLKGVIPTVLWDAKVRLLGDCSLYKGESYDVYATKRTADYVSKNVCHYLNKQTFKLIDNTLLDRVKKDIYDFLRANTGKGRLISDFKLEVTSTPEQRAKHIIDVKLNITPFTSVRQFDVYLTAKQSEEGDFTDVEMK